MRRLIDRHLPSRPPSPLARGAWVAWAVALAIGSLFPITSWSPRGLDPLAFLSEPWPRWWTASDVLLNVLAYVPFGVFGALALWPKTSGRLAVLLTVVVGTALSLGLEALQNWLPSRIPSRLDILANLAGTLAGALLGAAMAPRVLTQTRLLAWSERWFAARAQSGWLLLAAWTLAQVAPQSRLFSAGDAQLPWQTLGELLIQAPGGFTLAPPDGGWASAGSQSTETVALLNPLASLPGSMALTVGALLESLTVIAALVAVMLIVTACTRAPAPRAAIAGAIVVSALAGRAALVHWLIADGAADHWASAGALGGLLCGALLALGASTLSERARKRALVGALLTLLLTGQLKPELAFQNSAAMAWSTGAWRNVAGFQNGIASIWPLLVLVWGLRRRL